MTGPGQFLFGRPRTAGLAPSGAGLQAFEEAVIDRLYALNAERAREEERLGLGGKKGARSGSAKQAGKRKGRKQTAAPDAQTTLDIDSQAD